MLISFNEPNHFRYIYVHPVTNHVHLLVPFTAGVEVSTDNTCKSDLELRTFFEGQALNELASYKNTLEFYLSLLPEHGIHYRAQKERLMQVNIYIDALSRMKRTYRRAVERILSRPSNLYSIQLRPKEQDPDSKVINPVFTVNRANNKQGTPISPLYNKMHEIFPGLILGKSDPREQLIMKMLSLLPSNTSFEHVQNVLAAEYGVPNDFFKKIFSRYGEMQLVDRDYVDTVMGFDKPATFREYIEALIGLCAPNLQSTLHGSPFYFESLAPAPEKGEYLSVVTQIYLGALNVYCRSQGISNKNFGLILEGSVQLSGAFVETVAEALCRGEEVESVVIAFFNRYRTQFQLSRALEPSDKEVIVRKFENTCRTLVAMPENPHLDDCMFLDTEACGEKDIFITHQGLICTDASYLIPTTLKNRRYFADIRKEARMHREILTPHAHEVITIDVAPEVLISKLSDVEWERFPKEILDVCRALPEFKVRVLLDTVAKGQQDGADIILQFSVDAQSLLRTPGKFTDYSGRIFHCTAYEYAYWAKDTHMQRMLEAYMDDETKALMLEKIELVECAGLAYQQDGLAYKNSHYDMSFILKNLSVEEFCQLKTMIGQANAKIEQATPDNYKTISFTATEYEAIKQKLKEQYSQNWSSFFYRSPAKALSQKLVFDFRSLITALAAYMASYHKLNAHQHAQAWMKVGRAQRDVPAHIAHEYCRPSRSFSPLPSFNADTEILPRNFFFRNDDPNDRSWFPLSSHASGLGINFALTRGFWMYAAIGYPGTFPLRQSMGLDLAALRRLDEVRIADLIHSRENLSQNFRSPSAFY